MSEATEQNEITQQQVPHERVVILPIPDGMQRMESGPVQFGDDWPGVFLRGDNAMAYSFYLNEAALALERNDQIIEASLVRSLSEELSACKAI